MGGKINDATYLSNSDFSPLYSWDVNIHGSFPHNEIGHLTEKQYEQWYFIHPFYILLMCLTYKYTRYVPMYPINRSLTFRAIKNKQVGAGHVDHLLR